MPKPNDAGLDLPAYLHPLGYITQIGDHLITTLPQQLEPYADSLVPLYPFLYLFFIFFLVFIIMEEERKETFYLLLPP